VTPLTARFDASGRVELAFGDATVGWLDPEDLGVAPSRAGHGDDLAYFDSEERRIAEETAAAYLALALGRSG